MERIIQSFQNLPLALPGNMISYEDQTTFANVLPLWRHMFWLAVLFVAFATSVQVRLDVQQLRKDIDRNERTQRRATVTNERLRLELDSRRRAEAVQDLALKMGIQNRQRLFRLRSSREPKPITRPPGTDSVDPQVLSVLQLRNERRFLVDC